MYLHISMLGKLYGQWMFLGSFRRWIWWMMRKNICWNLQNLIYRQEHFLDMYISIISKVGHAPLFRADIRGSEVTHTHVHTVRLSTYNTIQYNIYVLNYEVYIRWCNIVCGCICIALSTFLNKMMMKLSKDEDTVLPSCLCPCCVEDAAPRRWVWGTV